MQRTENGLIVISCDFCGSDWDEVKPMIEGHHGSILCLECLKLALPALAPGSAEFRCTMCIREGLPADLPHWRHPQPQPSPGLNPHATLCQDCAHQAAKAFSRDKDIDWVWENFRKRKA
jgi:hypothetical protein